MTLQRDRIQAEMTVKAKQARDQFKAITSDIKGVKDLFFDLEKGSSQFKKELKKVTETTKQFAKSAPFKDLVKVQRQLVRELKNTSEGTSEYKALKAQLDIINPRVNSLKRDFRGVNQRIKQTPGALRRSTTAVGKLGVGFKSLLASSGLLLIVDRIISIGTSLFNLGSELEGLNNKFNTVFGEAGEVVELYAQTNASAIGQSENQYKNLATSVGDLLIPLGINRDLAADLSAQIPTLSGALSQWSNGAVDVKKANEAVTKALLGEREQLKTLGIAINEADVKTRLQAKGMDNLTGNALKQVKALATLELITENSTDAQRNFLENTESLSRQQAETNAIFQEAKEAIAGSLIEAFQSFKEAVAPAIAFFADLISSISEGNDISPAMAENLEKLAGFAKSLWENGFKPAAQFLGAVIKSFVSGKKATGEFSRPVNNVTKILKSLFSIGKSVVGFLFDLGKVVVDFVSPIFEDFDLKLIAFTNTIYGLINSIIDVINVITQSGISNALGSALGFDVSSIKLDKIELIEPDTADTAAKEATQIIDKATEEVKLNMSETFDQFGKSINENAEKSAKDVGKALKKQAERIKNEVALIQFRYEFSDSVAELEAVEKDATAFAKTLKDKLDQKLEEFNATDDENSKIQLSVEIKGLKSEIDKLKAVAENTNAKAIATAEIDNGIEAIDSINSIETIELVTVDSKKENLNESTKQSEIEFTEFLKQESQQRLDNLSQNFEQQAQLEAQFAQQRQAVQTQFIDSVGAAFSDFITDQEKDSKAFGKAVLLSAFNAAEALVNIKIAEAAAASFASADSVATFGATGAAKFAIISALIKGAFAVAKKFVSAKLAKGGMVNNTKGGFQNFGKTHAQGGNLIVDGQTGEAYAEIERGEPYLVLSRNTAKNNGPVIQALLEQSMLKNGAPVAKHPLFQNYINGQIANKLANSKIPKAADGAIIGTRPAINIPNGTNQVSNPIFDANAIVDELKGMRSDLSNLEINAKATLFKDELDNLNKTDAENLQNSPF